MQNSIASTQTAPKAKAKTVKKPYQQLDTILKTVTEYTNKNGITFTREGENIRGTITINLDNRVFYYGDLVFTGLIGKDSNLKVAVEDFDHGHLKNSSGNTVTGKNEKYIFGVGYVTDIQKCLRVEHPFRQYDIREMIHYNGIEFCDLRNHSNTIERYVETN